MDKLKGKQQSCIVSCEAIVGLEKTLESPLDYKEIESINPKGNQPYYSLKGLMLKLKL